MTRVPFDAEVREQSDVTTIDLHGEINSFAEQRLNEVYDEASSRDTIKIALNFSDVSYMNSTGIALIVALLAQARKNQRELVVYGLSDHYEEIFRITRLADFMTIYPDEMSVLAK